MEDLLNKGLGFVPIPQKLNKTQVHAEIDKFERTIKWKEHHSNKEHQDEKQEPATTKPTPPKIF